jgi:hypothetical protein
MRHFVEIQKFNLLEGEELMSVVRRIHDALTQHRQRTNKSIFLSGIFKSFIIVRDLENGRLFKMDMKRDGEGNIELGDSEEVRQVYVPIKAKEQKSEEDDTSLAEAQVDAMLEVAEKSEAPQYLEVPKDNIWKGILD